jgi:hypothetical protein
MSTLKTTWFRSGEHGGCNSLLILSTEILQTIHTIMISGFLHDVDEICSLLGYYTASIGIPLLMLRITILQCVIPHKNADIYA